jgi:hypothetical protein
VSNLGASFRSFRAEGGGVRVCPCPSPCPRSPVSRRAFFDALSRELDSWYSSFSVALLNSVATEAGDDCSRREGSTGGSGRLGFGEKWLAWVAISAATPSAKERLRGPPGVSGGCRYGMRVRVGDPKSENGPCVPLRFPGVELKTE